MYHYHHHHVVSPAWISLTLYRNFSLSFIPSGRYSGLHPVSSHRYCMYVQAGRPAFARPYVGVHRSTSLMSSTLLLQQCRACLVRLTWIVFVMGSTWPLAAALWGTASRNCSIFFEMGGRWPYRWCFVGCCLQDLWGVACRTCSILLAAFLCNCRLASSSAV